MPGLIAVTTASSSCTPEDSVYSPEIRNPPICCEPAPTSKAHASKGVAEKAVTILRNPKKSDQGFASQTAVSSDVSNSFEAQCYVSEPQPSEELEAGNPGLDKFLLSCLENPKDKITLLKLEKEIIAFLKNDKLTRLKFPPMSSYQRLIVHRVANHFGLEHTVLDVPKPQKSSTFLPTAPIVPTSPIQPYVLPPAALAASVNRLPYASGVPMSPPPSIPLTTAAAKDQPKRSVVLWKSAKSKVPPVTFRDMAQHKSEEQEKSTPPVTLKIMRRPSDAKQNEPESPNDALSGPVPLPRRTPSPRPAEKTLEEREEEYAKARARIFASSATQGSVPSSQNDSTPRARRTPSPGKSWNSKPSHALRHSRSSPVLYSNRMQTIDSYGISSMVDPMSPLPLGDFSLYGDTWNPVPDAFVSPPSYSYLETPPLPSQSYFYDHSSAGNVKPYFTGTHYRHHPDQRASFQVDNAAIPSLKEPCPVNAQVSKTSKLGSRSPVVPSVTQADCYNMGGPLLDKAPINSWQHSIPGSEQSIPPHFPTAPVLPVGNPYFSQAPISPGARDASSAGIWTSAYDYPPGYERRFIAPRPRKLFDPNAPTSA